MCVLAWSSSTPIPARSAWWMAASRSGRGVTRQWSSISGLSRSDRSVPPLSSERTPLSSASLNVRPIAITSPTDFIWVPRVGSASLNFSKFHLGILATT